MSSSADAFCLQCNEIKFDFFTKSWQKDQNTEKPPDISWSTLAPEHCRFCQLLLHCIGNSQGISTGTLRGVYASHELQLYMDVRGTSRRLEYSIQPCKPAPSPYPNEEPQKSVKFDVNELTLWLDRCKIHHCLPSDHSKHALPEGLRLIDVQNQCIIQPKSHVEYCALSYVWGRPGAVQQPRLTSRNRLETPNSLRALDLPKTILDAMDLCRDIKCKFLWVDSLCIVQDSGDDKHRQISSMADVYSQSFLAIIACGGNDANAGLAPYARDGNPGRNASISYLTRKSSKGSFVASLSPQIAAQEIAKSAWASRGWTLQEYALSRRVLFLTGSYAFLRCEKGLWYEDFGLGFSNCFENNLKWDLPLPPFYRKKKDLDRHYPSTFSQMLAQFVRRGLSYDEDILRAFTGILTRMKDSIGSLEFGTHLWGLPSKQFGAALQWTTNLPFPGEPRIGFPSWSWAGWIHANDLTAHNGNFPDMYGDQRATDISVLTCYIVEDGKNIRTVENCKLDRISLQFNDAKQRHQHSSDTAEIVRLETKLRLHFSPRASKELVDYIELHSPSKPPLSHHIFLWASCAYLYIDQPPNTVKYSKVWDFPIRTKKGDRQMGSIRLKPEWREMQPDHMPFFVSTAGMNSLPGPDAHPLQLRFKVILMKLYHNTKPAVYRRIQVSHTAICETDWTSAHPESRLIALV
jgi:hypothetical protein